MKLKLFFIFIICLSLSLYAQETNEDVHPQFCVEYLSLLSSTNQLTKKEGRIIKYMKSGRFCKKNGHWWECAPNSTPSNPKRKCLMCGLEQSKITEVEEVWR